MTKSQIISAIATFFTVISAVCAAVIPYADSFPPQYRFYGVVVAVVGASAGAVVTALNQSLSPNHESVTKTKADRLVREDPTAAKRLGLKGKKKNAAFDD